MFDRRLGLRLTTRLVTRHSNHDTDHSPAVPSALLDNRDPQAAGLDGGRRLVVTSQADVAILTTLIPQEFSWFRNNRDDTDQHAAGPALDA